LFTQRDSLIPAHAGTYRSTMLDKNGHASDPAEAVVTPTHFVNLSKNRPRSYLVTPVKSPPIRQRLGAGYYDGGLLTPHSLLRFAAIQVVECIKNLRGLAPKNRLIATEAVESIIRQIAEPQETTCELNIGHNLTLD